MIPDYIKNFGCNTSDAYQVKLNEMYNYGRNKSPQTMFTHRLRINLVFDTMSYLVNTGAIKAPESKSAIDIGCNAGTYSKLISDFGFKDVLGVDISEEVIVRANKYFGKKEENSKIHFEVLNAEKLNAENEFDFVLCTEVIEHTGNPDKVIDNIGKALKPGGIAIVSLPNVFSMPFLLIYLAHKIKGKVIDQELKDHLSYPFYKSKRLFAGKNLKLIRTTGTNLFYFGSMHKLPGFAFINKINYYLSKTILFKNFTQFYFMVFTKPAS